MSNSAEEKSNTKKQSRICNIDNFKITNNFTTDDPTEIAKITIKSDAKNLQNVDRSSTIVCNEYISTITKNPQDGEYYDKNGQILSKHDKSSLSFDKNDKIISVDINKIDVNYNKTKKNNSSEIKNDINIISNKDINGNDEITNLLSSASSSPLNPYKPFLDAINSDYMGLIALIQICKYGLSELIKKLEIIQNFNDNEYKYPGIINDDFKDKINQINIEIKKIIFTWMECKNITLFDTYLAIKNEKQKEIDQNIMEKKIGKKLKNDEEIKFDKNNQNNIKQLQQEQERKREGEGEQKQKQEQEQEAEYIIERACSLQDNKKQESDRIKEFNNKQQNLIINEIAEDGDEKLKNSLEEEDESAKKAKNKKKMSKKKLPVELNKKKDNYKNSKNKENIKIIKKKIKYDNNNNIHDNENDIENNNNDDNSENGSYSPKKKLKVECVDECSLQFAPERQTNIFSKNTKITKANKRLQSNIKEENKKKTKFLDICDDVDDSSLKFDIDTKSYPLKIYQNEDLSGSNHLSYVEENASQNSEFIDRPQAQSQNVFNLSSENEQRLQPKKNNESDDKFYFKSNEQSSIIKRKNQKFIDEVDLLLVGSNSSKMNLSHDKLEQSKKNTKIKSVKNDVENENNNDESSSSLSLSFSYDEERDNSKSMIIYEDSNNKSKKRKKSQIGNKIRKKQRYNKDNNEELQYDNNNINIKKNEKKKKEYEYEKKYHDFAIKEINKKKKLILKQLKTTSSDLKNDPLFIVRTEIINDIKNAKFCKFCKSLCSILQCSTKNCPGPNIIHFHDKKIKKFRLRPRDYKFFEKFVDNTIFQTNGVSSLEYFGDDNNNDNNNNNINNDNNNDNSEYSVPKNIHFNVLCGILIKNKKNEETGKNTRIECNTIQTLEHDPSFYPFLIMNQKHREGCSFNSGGKIK